MRSSAKSKRDSRSTGVAREARERRASASAHYAQHIDAAPIVALALIAAAAPLVWSFPELPTMELHPMRMPSTLSLLIFIIAILHTIVYALRSRLNITPRDAHIDAVNIALFLFVALCAASCIDSISGWDSAIEMVNTLSFAAAFVIASSANANLALALLLAVLVGGYVESLIALREYCASYAAGLKDWRAFGTFQNPNLLGGYMSMCLPVAVALALHFKRAALRFACWLISLLLALALAVSGSKGALMALLIAAAIFAWLSVRQFRSRRAVILVLVSGLMLIAIVASIPTLRHRLIAALSGQAHSWLFRVFVWKAALSIIAAHPFNGTGIGTFHLAYPSFTQVGPTFMAHNSFLQIASECGIVTLLSIIVFIALCLSPSARSIVACEDDWHWLRIGCICACISFIAHNIVDCTWYVPAARFVFAILLACSIALCEKRCERIASASRKPVNSTKMSFRLAGMGLHISTRSMIAVGIIIVLLICILISLSHSVAALHARIGRNSKSPLLAIEAFERAIAWEPFNARHRIALANAYLALAANKNDVTIKRALKEVLIAIKLQPMRGANYRTLARVYIALGERSKAVEAYKMALKVNPHDTLAMIELGHMLELMGEDDQAIRMYEEILRLMRSPYGRYRAVDAPTDISAVAAAANLASLKLRGSCSKGELEQLKGDLELATRLGEEYIGFFRPQMGDAMHVTLDEAKHRLSLVYAYLSLVSERLGHVEQSKAAKRRALELNPHINFDELLEVRN